MPILFLGGFFLLLVCWRPGQIDEVIIRMAEGSKYHQAIIAAVALVPACLSMTLLIERFIGTSSVFDRLLSFVPILLLSLLLIRESPLSSALVLSIAVLQWIVYSRILPVKRARAGMVAYATPTLVLLYVVVPAAWTAVQPIDFPRTVGSLGIIVWGLGTIATILAAFVYRPYVFTAVVIVVLWALPGGRYPQVESLNSQDQKPKTAQDVLGAWLLQRPNLDDYRLAHRPYPVLIASAEGGGIYAAAHSYLALRAMSELCPQLPTHLFATVGVSGGGVGLLLRPPQNEVTGTPCRDRTLSTDTARLTEDFLSPLLANALFLQPIGWFSPWLWRGLDGGATFASALGEGNAALSQSVHRSWSAAGASSALMFVSTNAGSGRRVVFAPFRFTTGLGAETYPFDTAGRGYKTDISVADAAIASARFPLLTQSARVELADGRPAVLVDGGYADNTGASTAVDLLREIRLIKQIEAPIFDKSTARFGKRCDSVTVEIARDFNSEVKWDDCSIVLFIGYIAMTSAEVDPQDRPLWQSTIVDPFRALQSARDVDAFRALTSARFELAGGPPRATIDVDDGFFHHAIPIEELKLPLGWLLSERRANALLKDIVPASDCNQPDLDAHRPVASESLMQMRNGCAVRVLGWLFNLRRATGGFAIRNSN